MSGHIVFRVQAPGGDHVVIVQATTREQAKHRAYHHLHGDADKYIVTPLTVPGYRVTYVDVGAS